VLKKDPACSETFRVVYKKPLPDFEASSAAEWHDFKFKIVNLRGSLELGGVYEEAMKHAKDPDNVAAPEEPSEADNLSS